MTLQEQMDAFKANFKANQPAEVLAIMEEATEALRRSGLVERALGPGDSAPHFALPDGDGQRIDFQHLLERGPLVLTFYRGKW